MKKSLKKKNWRNVAYKYPTSDFSALYPCISPVGTLFFIKPYNNWIRGKFQRSRVIDRPTGSSTFRFPNNTWLVTHIFITRAKIKWQGGSLTRPSTQECCEPSLYASWALGNDWSVFLILNPDGWQNQLHEGRGDWVCFLQNILCRSSSELPRSMENDVSQPGEKLLSWVVPCLLLGIHDEQQHKELPPWGSHSTDHKARSLELLPKNFVQQVLKNLLLLKSGHQPNFFAK